MLFFFYPFFFGKNVIYLLIFSLAFDILFYFGIILLLWCACLCVGWVSCYFYWYFDICYTQLSSYADIHSHLYFFNGFTSYQPYLADVATLRRCKHVLTNYFLNFTISKQPLSLNPNNLDFFVCAGTLHIPVHSEFLLIVIHVYTYQNMNWDVSWRLR